MALPGFVYWVWRDLVGVKSLLTRYVAVPSSWVNSPNEEVPVAF